MTEKGESPQIENSVEKLEVDKIPNLKDSVIIFLFSYIGMIIALFVAIFIFLSIDRISDVAIDPDITEFSLFLQSILLLLLLFIVIRWRKLSWSDIGFRKCKIKWIFFSVFSGIMAAMLIPMLNGLIKKVSSNEDYVNPQFSVVSSVSESAVSIIILYLAIVIVAPITEEILFRGVLFRAICQKFSVFLSASLSSLLFAAMHNLEFMLIPSLTIVGVLFCYLYFTTQSLWPAIIAHATMNLIGVTIMVLAAGHLL